MKKLALLQLLLLPLAAIAEGSGYEAAAANGGREQTTVEIVVESCEAGLRDLAKRLVGSSYAQGAAQGRLH